MVQTARDAQGSEFNDWMGTGGIAALIGVVLGAVTLVAIITRQHRHPLR